MADSGSFFSGFYALNDLSDVSAKITEEGNLPNFTGITDEDKSHINQARYNLFSLLLPIHDRNIAVKEFVELAK